MTKHSDEYDSTREDEELPLHVRTWKHWKEHPDYIINTKVLRDDIIDEDIDRGTAREVLEKLVKYNMAKRVTKDGLDLKEELIERGEMEEGEDIPSSPGVTNYYARFDYSHLQKEIEEAIKDTFASEVWWVNIFKVESKPLRWGDFKEELMKWVGSALGVDSDTEKFKENFEKAWKNLDNLELSSMGPEDINHPKLTTLKNKTPKKENSGSD